MVNTKTITPPLHCHKVTFYSFITKLLNIGSAFASICRGAVSFYLNEVK